MLQRLVLLFVVLLLPACALDTEDEADSEEVAETEEAITAGPQWRMATLVVRNIDASINLGGQNVRVQGRMSAATTDKAKAAARALPEKFAQWNGGRAPATMAVIDVPEAIRNVSYINQERGWWPRPEDVTAILDKYAPPGRYDSVFIAWDPDATGPDIPSCCAFGLGPSAETNGATYAVIQPFAMNPEAMVHEWLHGASKFYRSKGFDVPDPHENREFGFLAAADGTWHHWYQPLLRGALLRMGKVVGLTSRVWRSGTPRRWIGGSYPNQAKPALGQLTMRDAHVEAADLFFSWRLVQKTSAYGYVLLIKHADGTVTPTVSGFGMWNQAANYNWERIHRADICQAARTARVPLAAVRMAVDVWPDDDRSKRDRMNVTGTVDCR